MILQSIITCPRCGTAKKGNDADPRLPIFLRVHRLRYQTAAQVRRLLCLLLLWIRALSANAGRTRAHLSERHYLMSEFGTKRTIRPHPRLSAIGVTADKYERRP